jgi:hypothetical protein
LFCRILEVRSKIMKDIPAMPTQTMTVGDMAMEMANFRGDLEE